MIYVASPYSSPLAEMQQHRFERVRAFVIQCFKEGQPVYSPIVYCHEMAKFSNLPSDAEYWMRYNLSVLRHCEAMFLLQLQGWDTSKGVKVEMTIANTLGIEVVHFDGETFESIVPQ